jgi:hypothetical protein
MRTAGKRRRERECLYKPLGHGGFRGQKKTRFGVARGFHDGCWDGAKAGPPLSFQWLSSVGSRSLERCRALAIPCFMEIGDLSHEMRGRK